MDTLTDRGVILAHLISGASLTINDGTYPKRGAWLNRCRDREMEVDYDFADQLISLDLVRLDSGNFDTGDHHYYFRVVTHKRNGKWRLDVERDSTACQMVFGERYPNAEKALTKIEKAVFYLNKGQADLRDQAIAEGYIDEECTKCKGVLLAHHHFVSCGLKNECPMSNGKSVLQMFYDSLPSSTTEL